MAPITFSRYESKMATALVRLGVRDITQRHFATNGNPVKNKNKKFQRPKTLTRKMKNFRAPAPSISIDSALANERLVSELQPVWKPRRFPRVIVLFWDFGVRKAKHFFFRLLPQQLKSRGQG